MEKSSLAGIKFYIAPNFFYLHYSKVDFIFIRLVLVKLFQGLFVEDLVEGVSFYFSAECILYGNQTLSYILLFVFFWIKSHPYFSLLIVGMYNSFAQYISQHTFIYIMFKKILTEPMPKQINHNLTANVCQNFSRNIFKLQENVNSKLQ